MKIGDLNMHCDNCDIIDYCNNYEDTPPCAQGRFKNVDTSEFLILAETSKYSSKNGIINDVHRRLNA